MRNILACLLFILSIYFVAGAESARDSPRRSRAPLPAPTQAIDFDCPEEFGYYAHPTDCTQYYVCVFGGALLESCTGGLMYSHELQTCDWPRNVGCAPGATAQVQQQQVQQREPEIRSRGQSSRLLQQQQREPPQTVATKHDLYTEEEQLGPAEELESDRQQRVYRGQPSTIGQVASDRDAISTHSNAIPVPTGGREKLSVISFGTQQQYTSQYQEARQPKFDGQPLSWSSYQPKVLYRFSIPPTPIVQPPIVQHTPIYNRRPQQPVKYKFNPSDARAINHQLQVNKPTPATSSLQQLGYQKRFTTTTRPPPQLIYRKRPSNIYFTTTPTYELTSNHNKANNRNIQEKSTESSSNRISKERSEIQKNDSNNGEEEEDDNDDDDDDEEDEDEEENKVGEKTVENEATKTEDYQENESEKSVSKQTTEQKDSKSISEVSIPKFPEPPDSFYRDSTYEDHNPFANHDFNFDKFLADLRNVAIDPTITTQRNPTTRSSHLYHANYAITNNPYPSNHQTTSASTAKSINATNATTPKPNNIQSDEDYYDDYEDYDNRSATLLLPPKVPKRLQELDNEEYEDESEEDYYDSEEDIDDSLEDGETDEQEEVEPSNQSRQTENTQQPKLRIVVDQTTPQLIFHSSGLVTRCPPRKRCYDTITTRKPYTEHVSTTERVQSQNIRPLINHISTHFPINYRHTITPNTSQPTPFTTSPSPPDLRKKLRQRLNKPGETDLRQEYKDKAHTQRTLTRLRASVTPAQQSYVDQQQNTVPSRGYNTSRYVPSQYDSPFYSLYDDDLYKDIGDFNQYNTQSNYRTQTYKEKKPQLEIVQQEPVQRGSTYSKSKYNTQSQDLYQSVTPQEYDTYSIQTNDDLPYRQTIQTKPSTRSGVKESDGSNRSRLVQLSAGFSQLDSPSASQIGQTETRINTEITPTIISPTTQGPIAERLIQTPSPFRMPESTTLKTNGQFPQNTEPIEDLLTMSITPNPIRIRVPPQIETDTTSRPIPIRASEAASTRRWTIDRSQDRRPIRVRGEVRGSTKYQENPYEIGDDEVDEKLILTSRLGPLHPKSRQDNSRRIAGDQRAVSLDKANEELERRVKLQYLQHLKDQENLPADKNQRNLRLEAERIAEEADKRAREEARRRQLEEFTKKTEEARKLQIEEAERKVKEDARRKQIEEAARKSREEARRKQAEEEERIAKEEARRKRLEEAERKAKEEARRRQIEEAEREAKELARRKQIEEAERKAAEEARRRRIEDEERKAKEEARKKQIEEEEWKARVEARQRQIEESLRKTKEDVIRKQKEEEKTRRLELIEAERRAAEETRRRQSEEAKRTRQNSQNRESQIRHFEDTRRQEEYQREDFVRRSQITRVTNDNDDTFQRSSSRQSAQEVSRGNVRGDQWFRIIVDNDQTTSRTSAYTDTRPPKKYFSRNNTFRNELFINEQVTNQNAIFPVTTSSIQLSVPQARTYTEQRKTLDTLQSVIKSDPEIDDKSLRVRPTTHDTQSTPGITRTNSRHRGSQTYTISPNEADPPNRGTPAAIRNRPTLKPSTTVVGKAAEFIDIYRYPPRRAENVYPTPQVDKTAAKCRKDVCLLPDCNCGGKDIPGDLRLEETPQIVLLTFDDSVNDLNKGLYSDLFDKGRTNPNGCPISATFYVSHEWTDYSQVQNLYASGHEIASHSVSHSFGEQFTQRKWTREIAGQREIIAAYGGVKMEDVRGMRAPFLAIGGNKMFKMLYDSNFTYDSSMPVYENRPPSWPYTLDYKVFHDCMIPPCPTRSYPGVWEMPMVMWQDLNGGRCSMGDACSNPPTSEGVYKMLIKNFERHFTTNRAPFGLFYHAAWFTQPHHKEGFIAFLDTINKMPEVWLVTNWQAIQWVRDPTPISRLNNFAPFQCNYPDRPKKCNNPKVCNLWHKSGVRYMRTCQPCPDVYPWTGKSGVRNSRVDNEIINE